MKTRLSSTPKLYSLRSSMDGAQLRTSTLRGTEYLVCPVVSKVGDNVEWPVNAATPEFIPAEVLKFATQSRNGRPFVMNHPRRDGEYVSANSPDMIEQYAFGFVDNARYEDGGVKCDVWIDPLLANSIGGDATRTIERLEAGETIEVSEGDFVVVRKEKGEHNGVKYEAVWELCIGDHLAALPEGSIGACSIEAGCGAGAIKASDSSQRSQTISLMVSTLRTATLSQARTPTYSGTESNKWSNPSFSQYIKYLHEGRDGTGPTSVSQCDMELKRKIASHSLLGDPEANNLSGLTVFPCVNPSNGKLNENALRGVLGSRGDQADISTSALQSARDTATRLLNSEFGVELSVGGSSGSITTKVSEDIMKHKKKESGLFKRLLDSTANILRSAMSNNQLRWDLYQALNKAVRGLSYVYDEDVETSTVKYCVIIRYGDSWDYSDYDCRFFQRTYTLSGDNNTITLNDDAVEIEIVNDVWKVVTTVDPVEETIDLVDSDSGEEGNNQPNCTCHSKGEMVMGMTKKELVDKLKASGVYKMDEKTLNALTEEQLSSMVEVADKAKDDNNEIIESKVKEDGKTVEVTVSSKVGSDIKELTPDEWWSKAPVDLRNMATRYQEAEQSHRLALVTSLKSVASGFTEDELTEMGTPLLEKLAKSFKVGDNSASKLDYSSQGFPTTQPITVSSAESMRSLPNTWGLSNSETKPS